MPTDAHPYWCRFTAVVCGHSHGGGRRPLPYHNEFNGTRTIKANWLERFLFAPHNVGHHLDHHLVASVGFRSLPKLHATLQAEPAYRQHAHLNDGFVLGRHSLLSDLRTQTVGRPMQDPVVVSRG